MSKDSRSGGKYTGNHTTLVPLAAKACDIVQRIPEVKKISPSFINSGLKSANGKRRVKIANPNSYSLLLSVRDNSSHQEVRVYVNNVQKAREEIARKLEESGITVQLANEQ